MWPDWKGQRANEHRIRKHRSTQRARTKRPSMREQTRETAGVTISQVSKENKRNHDSNRSVHTLSRASLSAPPATSASRHGTRFLAAAKWSGVSPPCGE